ncbi:MAG: anthranilate synthase component I [Flavobacteriaceae bacterium CG_4_8_14_3_um_filter_34_10]|nr:anthranilate synthase component I family protein [Flavobacteriia bacterium]OIP51814.1 MAG: anthranilate synthase component I [Flavobacteriaceae bacterium CG2_30_34_30]PIQ17338.1 MAG: anthranilate synthase component I [Flavobacteriaceae bacterium CG18_big_fil_WC_8_21_14_2_50_34_36]PIV49328.1 MAG: anthranilate synthase component I [Flavobacteriaceae bacterium CG02_land_8_20_14_3_00_34_13]PIX09141.1 MAG: anthranilate synthase component I [Flavobacteriaceae bacterium CG_4_8_14_3_um_filter_34_10]
MKFTLKTHYKKILADTITPVSVYLKIRDKYPNSLLLESSDYHANNNSFSYICCNPIASFVVKNEIIIQTFPDGSKTEVNIDSSAKVLNKLNSFSQNFKTHNNPFKFINNGLFGYMAYDAVRYFDSVSIQKKDNLLDIPDIYYAVYQNIIAINHFHNEAYLFAHCYNSENNLADIEHQIQNKNFTTFTFNTKNKPTSNLTDEQFLTNVAIAKKHCHLGNVFQMVISRRFSQAFTGDDFNVYRSLRNVNPSPYLFYFDYGNFKVFGSSPEAQLIVKNNIAEIHPIAGTYKRTGNDIQDATLAKALFCDEKENAEHTMLVDLARNDLSRHCTNVKVETYREVQFFSHVIHLVSKVTGKKKPDISTLQIVADTFPAGTLSGTPKHKALQLIEQIENQNRNLYGGAIGFMDFKGNFNHAIIIRSFISKNHTLHYQAGAGIVATSNNQNELLEVYHKLGALTKAISLAEEI